jgi:hypothetical protein
MRRIVLNGLAVVAVAGVAASPVQAAEGAVEAAVSPLGCSYEGPLGHLDVTGFTSPAKELAQRTPLTEGQRGVLDIHDYAAMAKSKSAEMNPGFIGSPHVRSVAISGEADRRQADVEVAIEWRSGDGGDISGRAVIGVTKCGEGRARLTTISVEFIPQESGEQSSPIAAKPTAAQSPYRQLSN